MINAPSLCRCYIKGGEQMAIKLKVIDVSEHQGVIDWEKVKPQIDGAILRCGYGMDQ